MSQTTNQVLGKTYKEDVIKAKKAKKNAISKEAVKTATAIIFVLAWLLSSYLNDMLFFKEALASSIIIIAVLLIRATNRMR